MGGRGRQPQLLGTKRPLQGTEERTRKRRKQQEAPEEVLAATRSGRKKQPPGAKEAKGKNDEQPRKRRLSVRLQTRSTQSGNGKNAKMSEKEFFKQQREEEQKLLEAKNKRSAEKRAALQEAREKMCAEWAAAVEGLSLNDAAAELREKLDQHTSKETRAHMEKAARDFGGRIQDAMLFLDVNAALHARQEELHEAKMQLETLATAESVVYDAVQHMGAISFGML
eukprot:TRINITY_DN3580_c0_g2_i2.p1 TRINITY_DN3580_c0_g2~~TRINITY_DN3580_c0_g2_i2.p1  ORF type:complete len:225 (-),score=53.18 TRINITY_DN3580_c0_g2_i2:111-785(-)